MAVSHVYNNTNADATGTLTIWNGATTSSVAASALVKPSDWNSAHNQLYTLTGNTLNVSTVSGTNIVFGGTNGVSLSGTSNSIYFVGNQSTLSEFVAQPMAGKGAGIPFAQSSSSLGQNSLYIYPVQFENVYTFDHIRIPMMITNSSSAAASVQRGHTIRIGIYTRNSTNATILSQHYSTSYTIAVSHSSNASWRLSIITAIGNSTSYNSTTINSAGLNLSSSLHGPRELILPMSSQFAPGEYWVAYLQSSSSAGAAGSVLQMSNIVMANQSYNRLGVASNATSSNFYQAAGMGTYSATTGAFPDSISMTQINGAATHPILFFAKGTV